MKKDQKFSTGSEPFEKFYQIQIQINLDSNKKCKLKCRWSFGCYVKTNKNFAVEFWIISLREYLLTGAELYQKYSFYDYTDVPDPISIDVLASQSYWGWNTENTLKNY